MLRFSERVSWVMLAWGKVSKHKDPRLPRGYRGVITSVVGSVWRFLRLIHFGHIAATLLGGAHMSLAEGLRKAVEETNPSTGERTMTKQQLTETVMAVFADEMRKHEEAILQAERHHGRASGNYV